VLIFHVDRNIYPDLPIRVYDMAKNNGKQSLMVLITTNDLAARAVLRHDVFSTIEWEYVDVDAGRFISMIKRDTFDYTEW
jgi:Flp pilus assembly protein CpaB